MARYAFITPNLGSGSANSIWPAMVRRAAELGHSLFVFPGGRLAQGEAAETLRNRVYSLVNQDSFDGMVSWVSALCGLLSEDAVVAWHSRFGNLPLVSFGSLIARPWWGAAAQGSAGEITQTQTQAQTPGGVTIDAYRGMMQLLEHFIVQHGVRRFAFIRGPREHRSSQDRIRAFGNALRAHGLDSAQQVQSDFTAWDGGGPAARQLLDTLGARPGRDFEALIASSDLLLYQALLEFRQRGYRVPSDMLAGGFNDSPESLLLSPPFTTVHMPFDQAARLAIDKLAAGSSEKETLVPSLLVRSSCSCFSHRPDLRAFFGGGDGARDGEHEHYPASSFDARAAQISTDLQALMQTNLPAVRSSCDTLGYSLAELPLDAQRVLSSLEGLLESLLLEDQRVQPVQDALSRVHSRLAAKGRDSSGLDRIIDQARLLVSDYAERAASNKAWKDSQTYSFLQEFEQRLIGVQNDEDLGAALHKLLTQLGIPRAWIVRKFDNENRLCIALDGAGKAELREERFSLDSVLPAGVLAGLGGPACFCVLPLSDEKSFLGHLVLEVIAVGGAVYEQIATALTGALKALGRLESLEAARALAARAEKVKTRFLANTSAGLARPLDTVTALVQRGLGVDKKLKEKLVRQLEGLQQMVADIGDLTRAELGGLGLELGRLRPQDLFRTLGSKNGKQALDAPAQDAGWQTEPWLDADAQRVQSALQSLCLAIAGPKAQPSCQWDLRLQGIVVSLFFEHSKLSSKLSAIDEEGVPWSLARQILILHGGTLELRELDRGLELQLVFPYPTLAGTPLGARVNKESQLFYVGSGDRTSSLVADLEARWGMKAEKFTAEHLAHEQPFPGAAFIFDVDAAQPAEFGILQRLVRHATYSQAALIVLGELGKDVISRDELSLTGLVLEQLAAGSGTEPVVFVLGEEADALPEAQGPLADSILIRSQDNPAIFDASPPRAFVVLAGNLEFVAKIRKNRSMDATHILLCGDDFSEIIETEELGNIVRFSIVHRFVFSPEELSQRIAFFNKHPQKLPPQTGQLVKRAVLFIDKWYGKNISRWQLASEVHVSEDYLTRIFHREMGISPWEYLTRLRIHRAGTLLRSSGHTVQEISSKVGFSDQAYFCRVFRRLTGQTPTAFRNESVTL